MKRAIHISFKAACLFFCLTGHADGFERGTIERMVAVADKHVLAAGADTCMGVAPVFEDQPSLGSANGWERAEDGRWVWNMNKCDITLDVDRTYYETCYAYWHERMHYVIGPDHVGPLTPGHAAPPECDTRTVHQRAEDHLRALGLSPVKCYRYSCRAGNRRYRLRDMQLTQLPSRARIHEHRTKGAHP